VCRHGAAAILVVVASCTFTPGEPQAPRDAQPDIPVDMAVDVLDASPTCLDRWKTGTIQFNTPVALVDVNSTARDRDPFLSSDELTVWFSSERITGTGDVYTAVRTSMTTAFGAASKFSPAATTGYDTKLSMTSDELLLVFGSDQAGGHGGGDVWQASRASTGSTFGAPDESKEGLLDDGANQFDPALSPDGLRLYFSNSFSPQRLTVASRTSTSANFGTVRDIAELNTVGSNADPAISVDEQVIVFSSTRAGTANAGKNLWFATRPDLVQPFGTPTAVVGVNTNNDDADPFLSADGCRLYFASDRSGNWDLFVATAQ
jgi:Tol biopolymer transport system component